MDWLFASFSCFMHFHVQCVFNVFLHADRLLHLPGTMLCFCVLNSPYTSVFEGRIYWPMLFKMYWQVACRSCKYFQLLHLYLVCGNLIVQNISIFYNFSPKCQFSKSLKNMMEVFKFQRHYFSALYVIFHILALEKNTLTHSLCEIIILTLWKLYFLV